MNDRKALGAIVVVCALALLPAASHAVDFGIRGGVYTDVEEPFFGIELLAPMGFSSWYFNPNVEVVAVSNGDLATANFDFHYDLPTTGPVYVWVGGGPAVIYRDPPGRFADDETDLGANLLAGVGWKGLSFVPYLQAKAVLSDDNEVVAAAGIRF